jgi:hypothetical protein
LRLNQKYTVRLIILLAIISLTAATSRAGFLPAIPSAHAQGSHHTGINITPSNQTFSSNSPSKITVSVNVSDTPPLNAFEVIIHYNYTILRATTVDYNNTVLAGGSVVLYCVDGAPQHGFPCKNGVVESHGSVEFAISIQGSSTPNITIGSLFLIRFNVISHGFAQIHIHSAVLTTATAPDYTLSDVEISAIQDGFYTDVPCGTAPCRPPMVQVSITPTPVVAEAPATFNVTVTENNVGATPLIYHWKWNDGSNPSSSDDQSKYSPAYPLGTPLPHTFSSNLYGAGTGCVSNGLCLVDLIVFSSNGVSWEITINVVIPHLKIVLSVAGISLDHQYNVFPGTVIHINATIDNTSTIAENATLSISLENRLALGSQYFNLKPTGGSKELIATWDTNGYSPRAYAIVVTISNYTSAQRIGGNFLKWENASSVNESTEYVFLISPIPSGLLSLNILQTTGLAALVLVAAVVALARFLKKPGYELEPLE